MPGFFKKTHHLDPCRIDKISLDYLVRLISRYGHHIHLTTNKKYAIQLANGKKVNIRLGNDLYVRPRRTNSDQTRIEVLSHKKMHSGAFGETRQSLGVLCPENEYEFKPRKRIIKIIRLKKMTPDDIAKESNIIQDDGALKGKPAQFNDFFGFICQREAPGIELFQLINELHTGHIIYDAESLLTITKNLFLAYREQVYDRGLVHTDLKPENIIINPDTLEVVIIDFGGALTVTESQELQTARGTLEYTAPECNIDSVTDLKLFKVGRYTRQSDVYALGLTIHELWCGFSSPDTVKLEQDQGFLYKKPITELNSPVQMSDEIRASVLKLVQTMTSSDPMARSNFESLQNEAEELGQFEYVSSSHSMFPAPFIPRCHGSDNLLAGLSEGEIDKLFPQPLSSPELGSKPTF